MPVAVSVNYPADKKPFNLAEDIFCVWTRMRHCSWCCRLRFEIMSLWSSTLRIFTPRLVDAGEDQRHVLLHIGHDQAELEPRKLEEAVSSLSHVANRPTDSCVWNQATRVIVPCSFCDRNSWRWHAQLVYKTFSAKNKTDQPPIKNSTMLVEAETILSLARW